MQKSLSQIRLRYYTNEEIRRLGVVEVQHASTYDRGMPKEFGVNDARMGLVDHTVRCPTCFLSNCGQHFGYVELDKPVYRLGTINLVLLLLRTVCRECAKPKFDTKCAPTKLDASLEIDITARKVVGLVHVSKELRDMQPGKERLKAISDLCKTKLVCLWCNAPQPTYVKRFRTFIDCTYRPKDLQNDFVKQRGPAYLQFLRKRFMPDDAISVLCALDKDVLAFFGLESAQTLMCELQIIPPPNIRPSNFVGSSKLRSENDMTCALQDVIRINLELKDLLKKQQYTQMEYETLYDKLQITVSGIVNHNIKRAAAQKGLFPMIIANSKKKVSDMKDRINGKRARLRGNLSGKRVDQSGRTVISGDASHDIDELGVPSVMMNKLTFPERVTQANLTHLQQCVAIGAYNNNGALAVRPPNHSTDHVIWIPMLDYDSRIDLASQLQPGWIVERHLRDGDMVAFNRQPSLWKASFMTFYVYRVQGLTVRLPLPVTKAFNADFDGDEMNIHSLQGYEAMAEAQQLMAVSHQIVTPQSNNVIIGLVQDSLVGAYRLTSPNCFLQQDAFTNLLCTIKYNVPKLDNFAKSNIFKSNNVLNFPTNAAARAQPTAPTKTTGPTGTFQQQELMYSKQGKPQEACAIAMPEPAVYYKRNGKICAMYTGAQVASCLIPSTISLQKQSATAQSIMNGEDVIIKNGLFLCGRLSKAQLGTSNSGIIHAIWRFYGPAGAHKFISDAQRIFVAHLNHDGPTQSILDCLQPEEQTLQSLSKFLQRSDEVLLLNLPPEVKEAKSTSILQETLRSVGSTILKDVREDCALANCVNSGSKGNVMNIAQISGCVGQQTVFGRRVQQRKTRLGLRTLLYFAPDDCRAEARGFVANSYISGLSPAEFFMHQMAGREGIVATAVNTSESGYNQRRMIKGQESQCVGYDATVRASSIIIQSMYGGDDLDGSRLEKVFLEAFQNFTSMEALIANLQAQRPLLFAHKACQKLLRMAVKRLCQISVWKANFYKTLDPTFPCGTCIKPILLALQSREQGTLRDVPHDEIATFLQLYNGLVQVHKNAHSSLQSFLNSSMCAMVLQAWALPELCQHHIRDIIHLYAKSLVAAGEGVGAVGATSIGEPSMQMTLNVFHYSGIADKNVTITGLPRFKQLINSVDTYETANMTAEIVSYEHSSVQINTIKLSDIGSIVPLHSAQQSWTLDWFQRLAVKGPFSTKFGIDVQKSTFLECSTMGIVLDWTKCARNAVKLDDVVRALRQALQHDAIVDLMPFWTSQAFAKATYARIVFAPWFEKHHVYAIADALQMNLRIRGIDYIKKSLVFQDKFYTVQGCKSRFIVETEGSNMLDLAKSDCVIPETIRSTNVVECASVLGISTGICVLQAELHKVLAFDGSYIDPRHTWLLADTMGRSGILGAMNRHHMESMGSSLLQRASFEQSLDVFEEGAAFGKQDALTGATERIIVGQPVAIGTGMVGIAPSTVCSLQSAQTIVGPFKREHGHSDTIVVQPQPCLVQKQPETLGIDFQNFALRLQDADKVTHNTFLESCATSFRTFAASKRILPKLLLTAGISDSMFKRHLTLFKSNESAWSSVHSDNLLSMVFWSHKSVQQGLTIIQNPGQFTNMSIEDSFQQRNPDTANKYFFLDCEILHLKPLEALAVPVGVDTKRVVLRQQTVFERGPFKVSFVKEWSGVDNVEAERRALHEKPRCLYVLETIDTEAILLNRCTDAQLANSFLKRLL